MWDRLVRAVHSAERVALVHARHGPLRREVKSDVVRLEPPGEIAARAQHDGVIEVSLRAEGDGLSGRVPEDEVVRVVERMPARGHGLKAEVDSEQGHDDPEPDRKSTRLNSSH